MCACLSAYVQLVTSFEVGQKWLTGFEMVNGYELGRNIIM